MLSLDVAAGVGEEAWSCLSVIGHAVKTPCLFSERRRRRWQGQIEDGERKQEEGTKGKLVEIKCYKS